MTKVIEQWKDIKGYEGLYQISNLGRVKSCDRIVDHDWSMSKVIHEKILSVKTYESGKKRVWLYKNNITRSFLISDLLGIKEKQKEDIRKKICSCQSCESKGTEQSVSKFDANKQNKDGFHSFCKKCRKKIRRKYYLKKGK